MIILGHGGSNWQSGGYQRDSLAAFKMCKQLGAKGVHTGVRITSDDQLVLLHDRSVKGLPVHETKLKDLNSNLGYKVTRLDDLLQWASTDFFLNLEVKSPRVVVKLVDTLKNHRNKRVLVTSLWHTAVLNVGRLCSNLPKFECGIIMSCRPLFIQPFLQLLPHKMGHLVWNYEIYDSELSHKLDKFRHYVYNTEGEDVSHIDGIITNNVKVYIDRKKERNEKQRRRVRKVYK